MAARLLALPFILASAILLWLAFERSEDYAWGLAITLPVLAVIYILSNEINWWWYQKHPPDLPSKVRAMLAMQHAWYQNLPLDLKARFRHRVALMMQATDFIPRIPLEEVPPDLKALSVAGAVQLTLGLEEWLMPPYEHVVIYTHPFPSPQYPDRLHISEIEDEDGTLLFSAPHLVKGFMEPHRYFHIGLYEWSRAWRRTHPKVQFPDLVPHFSEKLEKISGVPSSRLLEYMGLPEVDWLSVAIVWYFTFPDSFAAELPQMAQAFANIFQCRNFVGLSLNQSIGHP